MTKTIRCLFILLFPVYIVSTSFVAHSQARGGADFLQFLQRESVWADSVLQTLSLEERIAQLFMADAYSGESKKNPDKISELITKHKIGGLIFFQGNPSAQARLTNQYQSLSKVPLLIGMDAENGLAARLKQTVRFPSQMMLGAIRSNQLIYRLGREIGRQCMRMGVHVNFAPVLDINNNPRNPVINARSFGENRQNVTGKGRAYMMGMQNAGMIAVGKHFPGHGDTGVDSHYDLPVLTHSRERLDSLELYPFRKIIRSGIGGIMVSHLNVPALDSENRVATLSGSTIAGLLKKEFNFRGLVFTDALNMKGVKKIYKSGEIEIRALLAGNHVLLFSENIPKAIQQIKNAVKRGRISRETIDSSCLKILKAKEWAGLNNFAPIKTDRLWAELNTRKALMLRSELTEAAITLIRNRENLLPVKQIDKLKIASVAMGARERNRFQKYLGRYAPIDFFQIDKNAPPEAFEKIRKQLEPYHLVIVSKHDSDARASKNFGVTPQTVEFLSKVSETKKVIFNLFANPYALNRYTNLGRLEAVLVAYEDTREAQMAAAKILFGGLQARGVLPVTINNGFPEGTGIITPHNRLGYAMPEQVGISSTGLQRIDSIVKDAIEKKAMPGCQVLVARRGKIILNKSYGYHTYQRKRAVRNSDIYDLASLTKIAATVPVLMQLHDEGWIDINQPLSDYLPGLKGSKLETVSIREILAHQARLSPWSLFHWETIDTIQLQGNLFSRRPNKTYSIKMADHWYVNGNFRFRDGIFSSQKSKEYPVQVAKRLYIHKNYGDTIFQKIIHAEPYKKNGYKYSDLGFILFAGLIEKVTGETLNSYAKRYFYDPLGAGSLDYLPLERFESSSIVPTQNDTFFRRQWLRGYVHDPAAAMLGGVAGHAGLFSNAADLAKLMQLYLQEGTYGGKTYFSSGTVKRFISKAYSGNGNRRGLGFDKPETDPNKNENFACPEASPQSFGHTGFTGTMAWADPKEELIFVFLSNRICPNEFNTRLMEMDVRAKIQQAVYRSILPNR